jgi:hypothetical protein
MKKFFARLLLLLVLPLIVFSAGIFLPPTKAFKKSLFFSLIDKNTLLRETPGPRIIFIGGSNLSFGLNSELIKDSLGINPINTAIHASLGLKYMMANSVEYIKENDIVVISPEYQQFYNGYADGEIELLSIIIDVAPQTIRLLDLKQYFRLIKYIPEFTKSKFKEFLKVKVDDTIVGIYERKSFNIYGDVYKHWNLPKEKVKPFPAIKGKSDNDVFYSLIDFRNIVYSKKARLYITFPCYQEISFKNAAIQVKEVEQKFKKYGFNLLSEPERYIFPDSLLFNGPYHLIKKGVDLRTLLLIEDLKKVI